MECLLIMKKMPCLIVFNYLENKPTSSIKPECSWVFDGDAVASIKWDGTSCLIMGGKLFKRYGAKVKRNLLAKYASGEIDFSLDILDKSPIDAIPCQEFADKKTGHYPMWVMCDKDSPSDKYHFEGLSKLDLSTIPDGTTLELIGEKVGANPHNIKGHEFKIHGADVVDVGSSLCDLINWLIKNNQEGLVFKNKVDGRMCKFRRSDITRQCHKDEVDELISKYRLNRPPKSGLLNISDFKRWNILEDDDFDKTLLKS